MQIFPRGSRNADDRAMLTLVTLAFAGGYADAGSYLLAGSFTGHLTGNTVLALIGLGSGKWFAALLPILAVALFLVGTTMGLLMGQPANRQVFPLRVALPLEATLIACAPLDQLFHLADGKILLVVCLCLALGMQNGVFQHANGVKVHATYITGDVTSLVKAGIDARRKGAFPGPTQQARNETSNALRVLGYTWLSFCFGALISTLIIHRIGASALWLLEVPIAIAAIHSWNDFAKPPSPVTR